MGENLSNELHLLDDSKKEIESNVSDVYCSFYLGKKILCFSMELGHFPAEYQVRKILE